jgi:hypothetical protein
MLFLLATLASATTAPMGRPPATASVPHHCQLPALTYAAPKSNRHGAHRLGQEPLTSEYLAVHRQIGGCPNPAIVATGLGR